MRHQLIIGLALALAGLTACAPQAAYEARDDLGLTSQAASQAATETRKEIKALGPLSDQIRFDVRDIQDVERWFDQKQKVSFD